MYLNIQLQRLRYSLRVSFADIQPSVFSVPYRKLVEIHVSAQGTAYDTVSDRLELNGRAFLLVSVPVNEDPIMHRNLDGILPAAPVDLRKIPVSKRRKFPQILLGNVAITE